MPNSAKFSERLEEALRLRGLPKSELATKMDVALSTVSRWCGGVEPHYNNILRIAKTLNVNAKWLHTGEGNNPAFEDHLDHLKSASEFASSVSDNPETGQRIFEKILSASSENWKVRALAAEERLRNLAIVLRDLSESLEGERSPTAQNDTIHVDEPDPYKTKKPNMP